MEKMCGFLFQSFQIIVSAIEDKTNLLNSYLMRL